MGWWIGVYIYIYIWFYYHFRLLNMVLRNYFNIIIVLIEICLFSFGYATCHPGTDIWYGWCIFCPFCLLTCNTRLDDDLPLLCLETLRVVWQVSPPLSYSATPWDAKGSMIGPLSFIHLFLSPCPIHPSWLSTALLTITSLDWLLLCAENYAKHLTRIGSFNFHHLFIIFPVSQMRKLRHGKLNNFLQVKMLASGQNFKVHKT